ncbi:MAG: hypothetical protein K9K40_06785, partial [Desulfotignum sp.]|nr:hypothetical protein [Desulfotignum sp.]
MEQNPYTQILKNGDYYGKILHKDFSEPLKSYVAKNISRLKAFDKTFTPAMLYLSAWQQEKKAVWYEFAGKQFTDLMACPPSDVAEVFRKSIMERRVYDYQEEHSGRINKQTLKQSELIDSRKGLRQQG